MPVAVALSIVSDILTPLLHMHGNGLAHRDLKPENILFQDTALKRLVIADLGLAAPFGTPIINRMGTDGYRPAAVQALPLDPLPHASAAAIATDAHFDVFSVTVILIQLLTGWRAQEISDLSTAAELEPLLAIFLDDAFAAALCDGLAARPATMRSAAALQRAITTTAAKLAAGTAVPPGITRADLYFLQQDALKRVQHAANSGPRKQAAEAFAPPQRLPIDKAAAAAAAADTPTQVLESERPREGSSPPAPLTPARGCGCRETEGGRASCVVRLCVAVDLTLPVMGYDDQAACGCRGTGLSAKCAIALPRKAVAEVPSTLHELRGEQPLVLQHDRRLRAQHTTQHTAVSPPTASTGGGECRVVPHACMTQCSVAGGGAAYVGDVLPLPPLRHVRMTRSRPCSRASLSPRPQLSVKEPQLQPPVSWATALSCGTAATAADAPSDASSALTSPDLAARRLYGRDAHASSSPLTLAAFSSPARSAWYGCEGNQLDAALPLQHRPAADDA